MVKYIPIIKQYIAKEDVINTIAFYREDPDGVDHALQSIMNIPAADVQPVVHGKWIYCSIEDMFHCTRCDAAAVRNTFVY